MLSRLLNYNTTSVILHKHTYKRFIANISNNLSNNELYHQFSTSTGLSSPEQLSKKSGNKRNSHLNHSLEKARLDKRTDKLLAADIPKRPNSSWQCYVSSQISQIKANGSTLDPFKQIVPLFAERWNSMSDSDKQPYIDEANQQKQQYQSQLDLYKQSGSYKPRGYASAFATFIGEQLKSNTSIDRSRQGM